MAIAEVLEIIMTADGKSAVNQIRKVGEEAEKTGARSKDSMDKLASGFTHVGAVMVGVGAVLVAGFYEAAKAADRHEVAVDKLDNTMENSSRLAGANKQAFLDQAEALQQSTKASRDDVIQTQALLGQFGLTQEQIIATTPLVVDLSEKMGIDLNAAAKAVGKSIDGTAAGLKRYGIIVDPAAEKTDAFKATVDALRGTVGGFSKTEGKTFDGQLTIMKNNLTQLEQEVGVGAVQAFNDMLGPVHSLVTGFGSMNGATAGLIGKLGTFGAVAIALSGGVSVVVGQVIKMRDGFAQAAEKLVELAATAEAMSAGELVALGASMGAVGLALAGLALVYESFTHSNDRAIESTKGFSDTLDAQTGALTRNSQAWIEKKFADLDAVKGLQQAGLSIDDVNRAIDTQSKYMTRQQIADKMSHESTQQVIDSLKQEGGARNELIARIIATGQWSYQEIKVLNDLFKAHDKAAGTAHRNASAQRDLASATDTASAAAATQAKAIQSVADAEQAATDPLFAYEDALQNQVQAQKDYWAALKTGDPSKVADAQWALAKASEQTDQAQRKLAGQLLANHGTLQEYKRDLENWVHEGLISQGTADDLANKFLILSQRSNIHGTVSVTGPDLTLAYQNIDSFIQYVQNSRPDLQVTEHIIGGPNRRAAGGPVKKGHAYIVGETRPELFVPDSDGRIIPKVPDAQMNESHGDTRPLVVQTVLPNGRVLAEAAYPHLRVYERSHR